MDSLNKYNHKPPKKSNEASYLSALNDMLNSFSEDIKRGS